MLGKVEVNAVSPGDHEALEPLGAGGVLTLEVVRIEKEALPQILPEGGFTFSFGRAAERGEVVGLDTIEVILALRVDHAEDGVCIRLAVNVRDAPVVAGDGHAGELSLPACLLLWSSGCPHWDGREGKAKE